MKTSFQRLKRTLALGVMLALLFTMSAFPASAESIYAYVSASDGVSAYADAQLSNRIGTIDAYSVVEVVGVNGSTAAILYNGVGCFADANSFTALQQDANKRVVTKNTLVYETPDTSAASLSIPKGVTVYEIRRSGDWAEVANGPYVAYIQTDAISSADVVEEPTPTQTPATQSTVGATVVASNAKLYASADKNAASVDISVGEKVNVIAINGSWTYLEYNGVYAYCPISSLVENNYLAQHPELLQTATPTPETTDSTVIPATVTATNGKVYASPSTSAASASVSQGLKVNVVAISGNWALVEHNGMYAYCKLSILTADEYLSVTPTPTVTPEPTATETTVIPAVVSDDSITVYQSPDTSSTRLGTLSKGTTLNVVAISGEWAQVEKNGAYGFCKISGLAPANAQNKTDTLDGYRSEVFDATVITSDARFYASASTSSANYSLPIGTSVKVGAYNDTWAYVQVNGVAGYVSISALSRSDYSTMRSGATGSDVKQLETALLIMGYLDTNPGTTYNDYTVSAVKRFQTACGLTASGEADLTTLRVLYGGHAPVSGVLSNTYSSGSSGDNVSRVQLRLYALGYLSKASSVDGDFGSTTTNAVKLFQACNNLSQSGSLDSSTLRALYSTSASSLPSGKTPADASVIIQYDGGGQQNNSTKISSTLASTTTSAGSSNASKIEYIIYIAQNQLGKPYVYGANGTSSYDCTGFTCYCYKQLGIKLKRSAVDQGYDNTYTKITSISDLQRGDLVFFNTISDNDLSDHAGIYLGAGFFIHASSGQHKVVISTLTSGYYNRVFSWGRRPIGG